MSDDADEIAELASWTDGIEANRAMPVGYGAPENAGIIVFILFSLCLEGENVDFIVIR